MSLNSLTYLGSVILSRWLWGHRIFFDLLLQIGNLVYQGEREGGSDCRVSFRGGREDRTWALTHTDFSEAPILLTDVVVNQE